MGSCLPKEPPAGNSNQEAIEIFEKEAKQQQSARKILLLGAGDSGKSTLFKQMKAIYGDGINEEERKSWRAAVHTMVIESMQKLLAATTNFPESEGTRVPEELHEASESIAALTESDTLLTPEIADNIRTLWNHPAVQKTFELRNDPQFRITLPDSCRYYMERLQEQKLEDEEYIPTQQDVLRSRVRTTGITENRFAIDQTNFLIVDVGGQRAERKKWIQCFNEVDALVFMVAVSEYDQLMFENHRRNRMRDALDLFQHIANSRWFTDTVIFLLLNKYDIFKEKVKQVPISTTFPEYEGSNDEDEGLDFFRQRFSAQLLSEKPVHTYITTATDESSIEKVFNNLAGTLTKMPKLAERTRLREERQNQAETRQLEGPDSDLN
jgi:GTPase SAR1 family protein